MIGQTLSHFHITAKIGEGGMGEVYRAEDTKLGRQVAIKVLPEALASDPERLARLEREAKVLASLNHPNIAAIYSLESAKAGTEAGRYGVGGIVNFLVMELVEGADLSQRIERGRVSLAETQAVGLQIATALEAAHDQGVIHRDLKPANIKVDPKGTVKVLDFGLAKALDPAAGRGTAGTETGRYGDRDSPGGLSQSPTLTAQMTSPGQVLGTPAYMAPEQIRGETVDKRADIWAFGVTLFELITGKRAFSGSTTVDSMAKILEAPLEWQLLPDSTPPTVRHLLHRCLEKDPYLRLRDIGEARVLLQPDEAIAAARRDPPPVGNAADSRGRLLPWLLAAILALALAATLGWMVTRPAKTPVEVVHLSVQLPEEAPFQPLERSSLAISPDGSMFVYVGGEGAGQRIYTRRLKSDVTRLLEGTEGAHSPFFSPDGQWIGFYVGTQLRKISSTGGPAQSIGFSPPTTRGQMWHSTETILVTPHKASGLWRVSLAEGDTGKFVSVGGDSRSDGYCWPDLLPGGEQALVSTLKSNATSWEDAKILLVDLDSGETRELIQGGSHARYSTTGHIVFSQGSTLMAAPFDWRSGSITGAAVAVIEDVLSDPASGVSHFAISDSGTLIYARGGSRSPAMRQLTWVGLDGKVQEITPEPRPFQHPRASPDGRYLAVTIAGASDDIWILDLERQVFRRITFGGRNFMPIWHPDSRSVAFSSVAETGFPTAHTSPIDGSETATPMFPPGPSSFPESWSPDGQRLTFSRVGTNGDWDVYVADSDRSANALLESQFNESASKISPDGEWIAFVSNESGKSEIYLANSRDLSARQQVSDNGGTEPVWSPDSTQLYFRSADRILAVEVSNQKTPKLGSPKLAVDRLSVGDSPVPGYASYDISPDGERFLMMDPVPMPRIDHLEVVLNWFDELERLVPTQHP